MVHQSFPKSLGSFPAQDYLYNLAAAVRQLAPESRDSHLFALEVRFSYLQFYVDLTKDIDATEDVGRGS